MRDEGDRVDDALGPWVTHNHCKSSRTWRGYKCEEAGGGPAAVAFNRHWWTWGVVNEHVHHVQQGVAATHEAAMEAADAALRDTEPGYGKLPAHVAHQSKWYRRFWRWLRGVS